MATITRPRRGTRSQGENWLTDLDEAPSNEGVEQFTRMKRTGRRLRWAIFTMLFFAFPLSLVLNLALASQAIMGPDEQAQAPASDQQTPNRSVAMQSVQSWLDSESQPMPGTTLLSWDRVETSQQPVLLTDAEAQASDATSAEVPGLETHYLSLMDSGGRLYTASVQVAWSEARGATVLSQPSVQARVPADEQSFAETSPWPGSAAVAAAEPVQQAVDVWADSYFSGDPEKLKLTVGDGATDSSYMPMPAAQIESTAITHATVAAGEEVPAEPTASAARMVAQVTLSPRWPGAKTSEAAAGEQAFTYDVLIEAADTAAPRVVGWGAPGTGMSLSAYTNATTGRVLTTESGETTQLTEADAESTDEPTGEPAATDEPTEESGQ